MYDFCKYGHRFLFFCIFWMSYVQFSFFISFRLTFWVPGSNNMPRQILEHVKENVPHKLQHDQETTKPRSCCHALTLEWLRHHTNFEATCASTFVYSTNHKIAKNCAFALDAPPYHECNREQGVQLFVMTETVVITETPHLASSSG